MGGGKGGGPPAQDPNEMMEAMARYNRVDQYTPQGSVEFTGEDRNVANVTLSPEQQAIFDAQQGVTGNALERMLAFQGSPTGEGGLQGQVAGMNELSKYLGAIPGFDTSGLRPLAGADDFGAERSRVEKAQFDRMMGLIKPGQEARTSAEANMLANRGVPESAKMADVYSERRGRDFNEQEARAAMDAVLAGGQEQSRLFGQSAQARQMGLNEMLAGIGASKEQRSLLMNELMGVYGLGEGKRAQDFNELAALLGMAQVGSPGAGMAGFWQPGQVDVTGASQVANQGWQAGQEYSFGNQMMDLAGTLGGAALGSMTLGSDEAFKTDIEHVDPDAILAQLDTLDIKRWRYEWEDQTRIGPMAQDFADTFGTTDTEAAGMKTLDVISALGVALSSIKALSARVKELEAGE